MAHNITERDGMFTVRQPAWHRLGNVLADYPSRQEAQRIAHPWEPISEPVYRRSTHIDEFGRLHEGFDEVEGFQAMVRSDDGHTLGVVSNTFEPVKNAEMYDIAEAIEAGDPDSVMYETGGSLKSGAKVWLLLRLREPLQISGDPRGATIPYFALQNSHDGSGAFRGQSLMTRIVCHEAGTRMLHEGRWITVEEHPSYVGSKIESGLRVSVAGLPFSEVVTLGHRYMTSASTDREDWTRARALVKNVTEIAHPIDMTVEANGESEDYWWSVGRWWADGHLAGSNRVGWSISDAVSESRLLDFLRSRGFLGNGSRKGKVVQLVAAQPDLFDMLSSWYRGEGVGKGAREKVPPVWVERLPLAAQRALVEGYFSGDGSLDKGRGGRIFSSSSLDGLLVLRRILMRLGQPSLIRRGRKAALASTIQGRAVNSKDQWSLRVPERPKDVRIEEGILYSKVTLIEWVDEAEFCPITTEDHRYVTAFGMSSNCDNTSQMADLEARERGTEFVFRHTKNVKARIEQAQKALAGWRDSVERYNRLMNALVTVEVSDVQREQFVERFIPTPPPHMYSQRVANNIEDARTQLRAVYASVTCRDTANTAYGLVQGAIEYGEHYRRARNEETRFKRAYLDRSAVTADALTLAREVAGVSA